MAEFMDMDKKCELSENKSICDGGNFFYRKIKVRRKHTFP